MECFGSIDSNAAVMDNDTELSTDIAQMDPLRMNPMDIRGGTKRMSIPDDLIEPVHV